MLPKAYRLRRRNDFDRTYRRGRSRVCPAFVVYVRRNRGLGPRVGFSVSKKIGKAVVRNRVKRLFRAAAAACISVFQPNCDYIFVVRHAALGLDYTQLCQEMTRVTGELKP